MNQLRFVEGLGSYTVNVAPESVWISTGMGTRYSQIHVFADALPARPVGVCDRVLGFDVVRARPVRAESLGSPAAAPVGVPRIAGHGEMAGPKK